MHLKQGDMIVPSAKYFEVHSATSNEIGLVIDAPEGGYRVLFCGGSVQHISSDYARACYKKIAAM